jgi:hypothetical protein
MADEAMERAVKTFCEKVCADRPDCEAHAKWSGHIIGECDYKTELRLILQAYRREILQGVRERLGNLRTVVARILENEPILGVAVTKAIAKALEEEV